MSEDRDALRDALRTHHPIMRSETGPFSGCRCGQVKLGQDVIAHVVDHLGAALASEDDGSRAVARIRIERRMTPDGGDAVIAEFDDGSDDGDMPAAVELLGMLNMTIDTVLHGGLYGDEGEP